MKTEDIVQSMVDLIEEKLLEPIDLDAIANKMGYSKFYLNRLFLENVGQTIIKYVRLRRLTNSAKQLVETDDPVLNIAFDAGYQSQQSFHHAFYAVFGCTPIEYRLRAIFIPAQTKYTSSTLMMKGFAA